MASFTSFHHRIWATTPQIVHATRPINPGIDPLPLVKLTGDEYESVGCAISVKGGHFEGVTTFHYLTAN